MKLSLQLHCHNSECFCDQICEGVHGEVVHFSHTKQVVLQQATAGSTLIQIDSDSVYLDLQEDPRGRRLRLTGLSVTSGAHHKFHSLLPVLMTSYQPVLPWPTLIICWGSSYHSEKHFSSLVYYKGLQRRQIKRCLSDIHGKRWGVSIYLPNFPTCSVRQKLPEVIPFEFLWKLHYVNDWSNHWSLAINQTFSSSHLPQG